MRGLLAVLVLAALIGLAQAAGPYDGQWNGSWGGGSNKGRAAVGRGCEKPNGTIEMEIANGEVRGSSKARAQARISGTVAPDGSFSGHLGAAEMTGQFSGTHFQGNFDSPKCRFNVTADKS